MARMSRNKLDKLKQKLEVDTLWSFSRYNKYIGDPYGYYLSYVRKIKEDVKSNIYSKLGGATHDILEEYYTTDMKYEEMSNSFEEAVMEMEAEGYQYNRTDKDKNISIGRKYEDSIRHFFKHYKPIEGKVHCEKFITIKVGDYYFQGYVDFMHKDKETCNIIIEDFKTSTLYTGDKKNKESAQLLLYALGVSQKMNIPLDKISIRWNFLKYCEVECDLKSIDKETGKHKTKTKSCVRSEWIKESSANVKRWIKEEITDDELDIEHIFRTCVEANSLEEYPEVAKHFKLHDCYVYADLNDEILKELTDKIENTLKEIEEKTEVTNQYLELIKNGSKDKKKLEKVIDELWWTKIDKSNSYFFFNINGYSRDIHKPFDEFLKESEEINNMHKKRENKDEENLFSDDNVTKINNDFDFDSLGWD